MLGFLIDENEFEVSPAITRVLKVLEVDKDTTIKRGRKKVDNQGLDVKVSFLNGNTIVSQLYDYSVNFKFFKSENVSSYEVYINNMYYGSDITSIQINEGDVLKIEIIKSNPSDDSYIDFAGNLV
jgi:hypothetical protein